MKFASTSAARRGAFLGLALLLCAGSASAQLYKWTDANGKTHFSDQPPPAGAKPAAVKGASVGSASVALPYALATAVRNYPVTLYTTKGCTGCDQGRTYLRGRGIPFSEKTVSTAEDQAKLKEMGGDGLPFIVVGRAKATGYQQETWASMLNVALYPATKMLPSNYQYPPAVALAPPAPPAAKADLEAERLAAEQEAERKRQQATNAPSNAPPGFRF